MGEQHEPPQRWRVAPVHVVDDDHGRAALGEVGHQPHQPACGGVHRVSAWCRLGQVRSQRALGQRRRARRQLRPVVAGAQRREQLPRGAPRRLLLERAAACAQNDRPAVVASAARGSGYERRLADPGRPFDHDHASRPVAYARHPLAELGELCVAVEQHGHR
jgi:hypothetical protein